jgi:hypothetical protein
VIDVRGGIVEGLELRRARDVGPRLVRVSREEHPTLTQEGLVVRTEAGRIDHRSEAIASARASSQRNTHPDQTGDEALVAAAAGA